MQTQESFISACALLGEFFRQFPEGDEGDKASETSSSLAGLNKIHLDGFSEMLGREHLMNPWFTPDSVRCALSGIARMLEPEVLRQWLAPYGLDPLPDEEIRTVGLVMAGNIPLVGFHDLLCVLASGHRVLAKPSSKDDRLIRKVAELFKDIDPGVGGRIAFTMETLTGMDAVIATGSNNSARYFEYYFRNIPHVIRKNRNGIAVLTGEETQDELYALGKDIFTYFGMGCRNVTKLFIPLAYDLTTLLRVLDRFSHLNQHHKYGNNVDYYRSIYLMNQVPILDNGVLLLKEDPAIASPVGVVFYERYSEIAQVQDRLKMHQDEIQCIVSTHPAFEDAIAPGSTQKPMPWDYADGVDTLEFLKEQVR